MFVVRCMSKTKGLPFLLDVFPWINSFSTTPPPIIMVQWKIGVSPILVSFHLGAQFSTKRMELWEISGGLSLDPLGTLGGELVKGSGFVGPTKVLVSPAFQRFFPQNFPFLIVSHPQ